MWAAAKSAVSLHYLTLYTVQTNAHIHYKGKAFRNKSTCLEQVNCICQKCYILRWIHMRPNRLAVMERLPSHCPRAGQVVGCPYLHPHYPVTAVSLWRLAPVWNKQYCMILAFSN